jgi:hypothetical protein
MIEYLSSHSPIASTPIESTGIYIRGEIITGDRSGRSPDLSLSLMAKAYHTPLIYGYGIISFFYRCQIGGGYDKGIFCWNLSEGEGKKRAGFLELANGKWQFLKG